MRLPKEIQFRIVINLGSHNESLIRSNESNFPKFEFKFRHQKINFSIDQTINNLKINLSISIANFN